MSPASYLAAPPRDAASIVAAFGAQLTGPGPVTEPGGDLEANAENEHSGDRVEHEVVPGDDDREHDERRVEGAREPHEMAAREAPDADPDPERIRGVERGDRGDRVRKRGRGRGADVDPREREQGVLEPDSGEARRRGREDVMDHDGDRRRGQETVAVAAEPG